MYFSFKSQELHAYLQLEQTIRTRLQNRSSATAGKRCLYTKGDSFSEDTPAASPEKRPRLGYSCIQIAPAPPSNMSTLESIPVVKPPPASLRFSQNMLNRRKSIRISDNDAVIAMNDIPIVPAPPAAMRFSQCMLPRDKPNELLEEPVPHLDTTETRVPGEPVATDTDGDEADASSLQMDALRAESVTPTQSVTILEDILLSDQPSTSRAAREAFERSQNKTNNKSAQQMQSTEKTTSKKRKNQAEIAKKDAFKRPAKRAEKTTNEAESNGELNDTIRRSKRGQIPLRNNICHTLSDPFAYMRKALSKTVTGRSFIEQQAQRKVCSAAKKRPIFTSTPINEQSADGSTTRKRKRGRPHLEQADDMSGITKMPAINEDESEAGRKKSSLKQVQPESEEHLEANPNADAPPADPISMPLPILETEVKNEVVISDEAPSKSQSEVCQLINWLLGSDSQVAPHSLVEEPVESNAFIASPASKLQFTNIGGIEYAFYDTEDCGSLGYMRFAPLQERGYKRNKSNILRFIVIYGQFDVVSIKPNSTEDSCVSLHTGDMLEIKIGCRFNIVNRLNQVGLLIVNRTSIVRKTPN
ncbi:hypothetical protein KR222_001996 [Zaprionus bogoriensis]|nr:hypothetical protein KR222_001996 [Zaprionus bogoriensis]